MWLGHGMLAAITLFWHDWVEAVFRINPDSGDGSAEWLIILILIPVTVALAVAAPRQWRRAALAAP